MQEPQPPSNETQRPQDAAGDAGNRSLLLAPPLTSLVGREVDVDQLGQLLRSGQLRLITLTGPGGVGKTRLALQVAASWSGTFADGAFFVSLAALNNPDLLYSAIAQTLGVREQEGQSLFDSLCAALRGKHLLLILDNFEQIAAAGPQVIDLLLCAPRLVALVTSRAALRVYGEQEYPVVPLALPDTPQSSPDQLGQFEAVRLFIERARAAKPNFRVNNNNAPAVAAICQRLDGLPLAIELAAARIKIMSPQAMLQRLDHTLSLLTGGALNTPRRHQTFHNTIAWSYDLLSEAEKSLFCALSIFVGGCTIEAAQAVVGAGRQDEATVLLDELAALIDKSLLLQNGSEEGEPRFTMLETIREYALERLLDRPDWEMIAQRHSDYFVELAELAEPALTGAGQSLWLDRLAAEHDNFRAVLLRAQLAADTETALRLAGALFYFWYTRGFVREGRKWLGELLAQGGNVAPAVRSKALNSMGNLAGTMGDYSAARTYHSQVLEVRRELNDTFGVAVALGNLANTARLQGDYPAATLLREQALELLRSMEGGPRILGAIGSTLHELARLAYFQSEQDLARRLCDEALQLQRDLGDKRGMALTLDRLGLVAASVGKLDLARDYVEQSLDLSRELGNRAGVATALLDLGTIVAAEGDSVAAFQFLADSLRERYETGNRHVIAECLHALAAVQREQSEPSRMVVLFAAADALYKLAGSPATPPELAHREKWLSFAAGKLSPHDFAAAWERGSRTPMNNAVALALQDPAIGAVELPTSPLEPVPPVAAPDRSDLTPRELEVLRLVAAGLTNPGIAEHLYVSINTVQTHLRSIFSKIAVNTRGAAVRYAFEHHLV